MARNKNYLNVNGLLEAGILEVSTTWDGTTYNNGDGTNEDEMIANIEANNSFTDVGFFVNLSVTHTQDNEKIINTDRCGDGELRRSSELVPSLAFTWQEVNNLELLSQFLGLSVQNVAGVLVPAAVQVIANPFTPNLFYPIANQNGNGGIITINSVTGSVDGALTANSDYHLVNEGGVYGIVLNTVAGGPTITTLAQTITINYQYTPNVSQLMSYKRQSRSIPGNLFKFTTCPNDNGESNIFYLVDSKVNSEVVMAFINEKTTDFAGADMTFEVADGGNFIEKKQTLTL